MEDKKEPLDAVAVENARVSYQVAVTLWTYQGSLNWNRFNVMLTANSIIVAGIGIILPNARSLPVFAVALPIMGLFLCLAWSCLMARGYAYHKYWNSRAVEIEENKDFHFGIKIAKEAPLRVKFNWLARRGEQEPVSYIVIGIFVCIFILALVSIFGTLRA